MRRFELLIFPLLAATVAFLSLHGPGFIFAEQEKTERVSFRWIFAAIKNGDKNRQLITITRNTVLHTGDQLKMLIEPQTRCFVYLIYQSPQDKIYMLFPYDFHLFDTVEERSKQYYIPQGDSWFELDENTGIETFYLLASFERLTELDNLYAEYTLAKTPSRKQKLGKQILMNIRKLNNRNRELTARAERPLRISGTVRGIGEEENIHLKDLADIAVNISATHFYSQTFTIDHQ